MGRKRAKILSLETISFPMAFFSVVIPLYNKAQFVGKTLQSVLAQTFADIEIIIVNDGSTDQSEAVVQQFDDPRIQYYLRENKGVAAARNLGITLASADYVAFLDADDYWYPDFLQTIHRNITRFPEQKVFTAAIEIETQRTVFPASYAIEKTGYVEVVDFFEASDKEAVIWTSAAVLHQDVFKQSGVFDTNVKYAEDTDLWMRVGLDFKVVFDWKILARYVYDGKSVSRGGQYFFEQSSFLKYTELEQQHPGLKKFLDLNRFSVAIKSKLAGDQASFRKAYDGIDFKNLNTKKKILLHLTRFQLQLLVKLKSLLADWGLGNSVFK